MEIWHKGIYPGDGVNTPVMYGGIAYTGPLLHHSWKMVVNLYNGFIHNDRSPAIIYENGREEWWANGKPHRIDGPAITCPFGRYRKWCVNGLTHREDGPAYVYDDGKKEWFVNGQRHRLDGPAIEWPKGEKEWWVNGRIHREDGPARMFGDVHKEWMVDGIYHRLDGPAIEYANGSKKWLVNGREVDVLAVFGYLPSVPLTEEEQMVLLLNV